MVADQVLLELPPAVRRPHPGPDGLVAHRQDRCADTQSVRELRRDGREAVAAIEATPPLQAEGEVAIGEPEPIRGAECLEALEDGEGVVPDPPSLLLVDLIAQPVGAEIRVGGYVDAERLDVVAGVGDHGQVVADEILEARRQLGAAGAPGEGYDLHAQGSVSGSPTSFRPAWAL